MIFSIDKETVKSYGKGFKKRGLFTDKKTKEILGAAKEARIRLLLGAETEPLEEKEGDRKS